MSLRQQENTSTVSSETEYDEIEIIVTKQSYNYDI